MLTGFVSLIAVTPRSGIIHSELDLCKSIIKSKINLKIVILIITDYKLGKGDLDFNILLKYYFENMERLEIWLSS